MEIRLELLSVIFFCLKRFSNGLFQHTFLNIIFRPGGTKDWLSLKPQTTWSVCTGSTRGRRSTAVGSSSSRNTRDHHVQGRVPEVDQDLLGLDLDQGDQDPTRGSQDPAPGPEDRGRRSRSRGQSRDLSPSGPSPSQGNPGPAPGPRTRISPGSWNPKFTFFNIVITDSDSEFIWSSCNLFFED